MADDEVETTAEVATGPTKGGLFFATIMLVLAATIVAEGLTATALGIPFIVHVPMSLVGLIAAIWMARACKSWDTWRRWILLPVAISAAGAVFITAVPLNANQGAAQAPHEESLANLSCNDLAALRQEAIDGWNAVALEAATEAGIPWPEYWIPRNPEYSDNEYDPRTGTTGQMRIDAWAYFVAHGGPELMDQSHDIYQAFTDNDCDSSLLD